LKRKFNILDSKVHGSMVWEYFKLDIHINEIVPQEQYKKGVLLFKILIVILRLTTQKLN